MTATVYTLDFCIRFLAIHAKVSLYRSSKKTPVFRIIRIAAFKSTMSYVLSYIGVLATEYRLLKDLLQAYGTRGAGNAIMP